MIYVPKRVDFGWGLFEVIVEDGPLLSDGEEVFGDADMDKYVIRIDGRMSEQVQREIFFHEIFHVLLEMSASGHNTDLDPSNEVLTTYLSRNFIALLRNNGWLEFYGDNSPFATPGQLNG